MNSVALRRDPGRAGAREVDFLAQLPQLGAERGRALPGIPTKAAGVRGLERRLAHLLGLGTLAYEIYQERDEDDKDEYRFRVRRRGADGVLMSSTTRYATRAGARRRARGRARGGGADSGYHRQRAVDGRHYFDIVDASGEVVARRIQYFAQRRADGRGDRGAEESIAARHGERPVRDREHPAAA